MFAKHFEVSTILGSSMPFNGNIDSILNHLLQMLQLNVYFPVFKFMILFPLSSFKHFSTEFTWAATHTEYFFFNDDYVEQVQLSSCFNAAVALDNFHLTGNG